MASNKQITHVKLTSCQKIQEAAKKATETSSSASSFLKSAGIMTPKGNLSPKFK
ncbi:MAG: hypothetical protein II819_11755 [Fibrobacter sp.]|nr:hypothetical protein [Fibrobacter sp.]